MKTGVEGASEAFLADTVRVATGNLEVARVSYEAWNRGALEEWISMHRQDVVVIPPEGFPESQPSEDRDAWLRQAMRLTDSWEEQRIDLEEMQEFAGGRVLSLFCWVTKGKDSGITLETPMAALTTVLDGQIARHEFFLDREEARRAAGGATVRE